MIQNVLYCPYIINRGTKCPNIGNLLPKRTLEIIIILYLFSKNITIVYIFINYQDAFGILNNTKITHNNPLQHVFFVR